MKRGFLTIPGFLLFAAIGCAARVHPMVAAGDLHSLALRSDGTVWAWGGNERGQLGDGTTDDRHRPVQVIGLDHVRTIVTCYYHNLALRTDGTVWAWGGNDHGQLGDGTAEDRPRPVQVRGVKDAKLMNLAVARLGHPRCCFFKHSLGWRFGQARLEYRT